MRVVIAGGSGFLGQKLATRLSSDGHHVQILTRRPAATPSQITWNPDGSAGELSQHLDDAGAVVNLAGENLAEGRWTPARKAQLHASRVLPTRTLVRAMAQCARPPRVFVSASAVGYYGARGDEPVPETTPPGSDFLATICVDWEKEARAIEGRSTRLALVRSGIALAGDGGALAKMLLPFRLGLGATLGSGQQFFPWIHVDDWSALVVWMIENDRAAGAFNATAPVPVTNREFTHTLARVVKRPALFRAPAFAMRAVMGQMSEMLLNGQRAIPACAEQSGFHFVYRELEPALRSLQL
jgi:uncharacterized protein (TIGR01777 family)